jgi:hypothetical protein
MPDTLSTSAAQLSSLSLGQFGPYQVDLINFGRFALDGGAMFGTVPKYSGNGSLVVIAVIEFPGHQWAAHPR